MPLAMSQYAGRIWENVPVEAINLPLSHSGVGRSVQSPPFVELRRWGRAYRPLSFQADIIDGLMARLPEEQVTGLIALPTGSGKTRTAAWLCLQALSTIQGRLGTIVWLAPQKELVNQAAEAMQAAWWSGQGPDSLDIRVVRHSRGLELGSRPTCLFLTPQMARAVMDVIVGRGVDIAVFDEAHHAAARVFVKVWDLIRNIADPRLTIGLSATPTRRDPTENHLLREAFGGVVYCSSRLGVQPVRRLIECGVLSEPRFRLIPGVPGYVRHRGHRDPRTLKELVVDPDRWRAVIRCISELELGQTVVYALDRIHGQAITRHLKAVGVDAEYLDGETAIGLRIGILERFRNAETRVLVNVALLIEGVDCPAAEALVFTYPVRQTARQQQMVGRVLRGPAVGGTEECRVWGLEGSQEQLDNTLFPTRYRYRGWRVETLGC